MNTDISALKSIMSAVQERDYVTSCLPLADGTGYTLSFASGKSIVIRNGKDGMDGTSPVVGVRQDTDGVYYWTLNGTWIKDSSGRKVTAHGITPAMKIVNGHWKVSTDNGTTWQDLGKATGENGDSFFKTVTETDAAVVLTLADGTVIKIPKKMKSEIEFDDSKDIAIMPGGQSKVHYTLKSSDAELVVRAVAQNGWKAKVEVYSETTGAIIVTAPAPLTDDEILVFVSHGEGTTIMKSLNFVAGTISISDQSFSDAGKGGDYTVTVQSNVGLKVSIPSSAESWISYRIEPATKAMETSKVIFSLARNMTDSQRASSVTISDASGTVEKTVAFYQHIYDQFTDLTNGGETANCYIINEAGEYRFPIIKGNGQKGVIIAGDTAEIEGAATATILWQDVTILQSVGIQKGCVVFSTVDNLPYGNALVAVKNEYGEILWSWHIWSTDYKPGVGDVTVYNHTKANSYEMMPLNIGAYSVNTKGSYDGIGTGLFYQWGRKDPFPHKSASRTASNGSTSLSIKHPDTFYTWDNSTAWNSDRRYDWWDTNVSSGNSSSTTPSVPKGGKTIYDPSPAGYRVPPDDAFTAFTTTGTNVEDSQYINAVNKSNFWNNYSYDFYVNNGSLHMPFVASGGLNASQGEQLRGYGYYQCAHSAYYTIGRQLTFTYNMVSPMTAIYSSALAGVIRPVKDASYKDYESEDYSMDGTTKVLQTHTKGNGIKVLIAGDGFLDTDIISGKYDKKMEEAYGYFFNVEPYSSFKEYFDVVDLRIVSQSRTFDGSSRTAFKTNFTGGSHIDGSIEKAITCAQDVYGIVQDVLVIVVINDTRYAGTCWMLTNGLAMAMVPASEQYWSFEDVLHHEAGGHGFAKLGDEYSGPGSLTQQLKEELLSWQNHGWYQNVDVTNDPQKVKWAWFLEDQKYKDYVGIYEGGYTVNYGVYRPTYDSIMNQNQGEYNAPSRKLIYQHIMQLAGQSYSLESFVAYDAKNLRSGNNAPEGHRMSEVPFKPLAAPVVLDADEVLSRMGIAGSQAAGESTYAKDGVSIAASNNKL